VAAKYVPTILSSEWQNTHGTSQEEEVRVDESGMRAEQEENENPYTMTWNGLCILLAIILLTVEAKHEDKVTE
jgi:cytochrome oxidase assembly protein ShyY1